jgi:hypothetical protein
MNEKFRIVLAIPSGYAHAKCFTEAAFLLKNSLQDLGRECDIAINDFSPDRTNVVLGYHLLAAGDRLRFYRYIPYQLEQLSASESVFSDNVKNILSGAAAVWDYSRENIQFLARHGIAAQHLLVGYHPALEMIPKGAAKDIDVLFFGSMVDRRKKVLDGLAAAGARVHALFGVYGKERDAFIARARIVINIHYYSSKIFEAIRTSYLFNNACCVVSEESEVYPYPGVSAMLVPYERLVDTCLGLLEENGAPDELGQRNYEDFRAGYLMRDMVKKLVA